MARDTQDLEARAAKFWPSVLAEREQTTSIIPKLIQTQEKFIGVLYVADASPVAWKEALQATSDLPGNLFLKHLIVLSDVGGEKLQRFRTSLSTFFPESIMTFVWKEAKHTYAFSSLKSVRAWDNAQLCVDGPGLSRSQPMSPLLEDVSMLLIHGGASIDPGIPDDMTERCTLGTMLGKKEELDSYVRQRYIRVSRITGGATANTMGQLCQGYVREVLKNALPNWDFSRSTIPGISQNEGRTDMSFDIVAQAPAGKCCAIEVSFQVTTNSTIERKSGQAQARQNLLHDKGHRIAYVIDGAGNFQRRSALSTICRFSDCTVTFRDAELASLAAFLKTLE